MIFSKETLIVDRILIVLFRILLGIPHKSYQLLLPTTIIWSIVSSYGNVIHVKRNFVRSRRWQVTSSRTLHILKQRRLCGYIWRYSGLAGHIAPPHPASANIYIRTEPLHSTRQMAVTACIRMLHPLNLPSPTPTSKWVISSSCI